MPVSPDAASSDSDVHAASENALATGDAAWTGIVTAGSTAYAITSPRSALSALAASAAPREGMMIGVFSVYARDASAGNDVEDEWDFDR